MKTLLGIARICVLAGAWFAAASAGANDWSTLDYDLYRADFNGDGRDDLLYVAKSPDQASGIALSDGSGPNTAHQTFPSNHLGITWHGNHYLPIIGDYNGDGRDDVFLQRQTPGDHYLILTQASTGQLVAIAQTIPNNHLGLDWNLFGRTGGYFLHGGTVPGSGGCIDLTRFNASFHSVLRNYGRPIVLTVRYPELHPGPPRR